MLTIKHISLGGSEIIESATSVWFMPKGSEDPFGEQPTGPRPASDLLYAAPGKKHPASFGDGTVFVMNEAGNVVSRYDLGASQVDFIVDPKLTANAMRAERDEREKGCSTASPVKAYGLPPNTLPRH
jgi:hypothetical protein